MKRPHSRALALLTVGHLAAACAVIVSGCSAGSENMVSTAGPESVGSVAADLRIDPGSTLNNVAYSIVGPSSFTKEGSIDVHASSSLTAIIGPIPAGVGFSVAFTGTTSDGTASCAGSAAFDITAGQTTPVTVNLACHEAPRSGSVQLNGSLNVCPVID
jgi:hypothetical protein